MKINLDKVREVISHTKKINIPLSTAIEMIQNNLAEGFKNNIESITEYNIGYFNAIEMIYSILEDEQPQYIDLNQMMTQREAYKSQQLTSCEGYQIGFGVDWEEEEWEDNETGDSYIIRRNKKTGKTISVKPQKSQKKPIDK